MNEKQVNIIVFSGDHGFQKETKKLLDNVGIGSVYYAYTAKETEMMLSENTPAVLIYDSLYGDDEVRRIINAEICMAESAYCIYICERNDEDLFGGAHPSILRLNRPYSNQSFYEAVLHLTYNLRSVNGRPNRSENRALERVPVLVTDLLQKIGVPAHIKGFSYLRYAIMTVVNKPEMLNLITKNLYLEIASEFQTTGICVERAIRHAIDVAWERGNITMLNTYFGALIRSKNGRPSNSEFIAVAANIIRDKLHIKL